MKVAIAGAGVAGRYLHQLMQKENALIKGCEVDIYDTGNDNHCGIHPCAWMVPQRLFNELLKPVDLNPERFILKKFDKVSMSKRVVTVALQTINKPKFLNDLCEPGKVIHGSPLQEDYDRIIDCTGAARAFLPPPAVETTIKCVQCRGVTKKDTIDDNCPKIEFVDLGYAWAFPLGCRQWHIGCGCFTHNPMKSLVDTGLLDVFDTILCGCNSGTVRLGGPQLSQPWVSHDICDIWGCGESIGCVGPIIGEGIVPAMECACRLVENWNSADRYMTEVNRQFDWINKEALLLQRLLYGDTLSMSDAMILINNAARMEMKVTAADAFAFFRSMVK